MKFTGILNTSKRCKLLQLARGLGLLSVIAVNAFVFLSDANLPGAASFKDIVKFVDHATEQHQVNETPFTITLHFSPAPLSIMDAKPALPLILSLFSPALIGQLLFGFIGMALCFCLFRGEENNNTQFILQVISPPPKFL